MRALLSLLLLLPLGAQTVSPEVQRIDQTIASLQSMRSRLNEMQAEIDEILRTMSEHRGRLTALPPAFGGMPAAGVQPDSPDKPAPVSRCAALTKDGSRCTRPATPGARYCKQHALARQK